jgi:hypothetical protein
MLIIFRAFVTVLTLYALLTAAHAANCYQSGNTTQCYGDDGSSSQTYQYGDHSNTTIYESDGNSRSFNCYKYGDAANCE